MGRRAAMTLAIAAAALAVAVVLRLCAASGSVALPDAAIVWSLRGERAAAGIAVGAALGVGGVFLQCLLRNPLAAPELLGLGAGASLAVTVWLFLITASGWIAPDAPISPATNAPAALVGSLGALALVYILSQRRGLVDPISLVLVGVIFSILCGALTMFVAYLAPATRFDAPRWTIGHLDDNAQWPTIGLVGLLALAGTIVGCRLGPAMDAASLGHDEARSVGLRLGRLRMVLFLGAGVLTAGAVVLAGPVGFVGLVCPHIIRLAAGPAHRTLTLGSALAGGALVVGADAVCKGIPLGSGRLPIGIVTALVGGPILIGLLRKEMR